MNSLLHRRPIQVDNSAIMEMVRGAVVLVTGAGGSIGSEICRMVACCEPERLILLGHGENSIFVIWQGLAAWATCDLVPVIADVRDPARLDQVFARYRPALVFHAAAYKHVPLMESNAVEAMTNNILGTERLLRAADDYGAERLVLISTDKAVNPSSVMGATKRVAELLVNHAAAHTGRAFVAVRFGNVLNSRGSVVPSFQAQIGRGGPVTVTDPEVSRFFITIPEAAGLVLQAATFGQVGGAFVANMGAPVRIADLAREIIEQSGKRIEIVYTGLRPGEKLTEELYYHGEEVHATAHPDLFLVPGIEARYLDWNIGRLENLADDGDDAGIRRELAAIVPQYKAELP